MKKFIFVLMLFAFLFNSQAQKVEIENEYQFKSLKKDCYLGHVEYNPEDKTTSLYYVEKDMLKTTFTTYIFDENLEFINEKSESFNIIDASKEAIQQVKKLFSWFKYRGESYTKEFIDIRPAFGGKLIASKQKVNYNFSWALGIYIPKYEKAERVKIKGEDNQKIYLYDHVVNTETGNAYMLVGIKAEKGSKDKYLHSRNFQILKLTNNLEVEYLEEINFDYNMAISFKQLVYTGDYFPEEEMTVEDIYGAKLYMVFSPIKTILGKKFVSPNAGDNTLIVFDENGKIDAKIEYTTQTTGWVIENMVVSDDFNDLYFYGPAKDDAYINTVMPTNSPLTGRTTIKNIKWKNFQVMKISGNKFQWINSTDLKEFKSKANKPPSQKQMPVYIGKKFKKNIAFITPDGELIITGQKYTTKQVPDPKKEGSFITEILYKDLIMFHFDDKGILKAQYGVRRDKMNKYSKAILTPQDVYMGPDGKSLYWVYGEIKGMRKGLSIGGGLLELAGVSTISKRKLLYFPAVSRVDLENGEISDFISLGADSNGKQKYYTNPSYPQLLSPDGKNLTFVGEDKKGSLIWLARMILE